MTGQLTINRLAARYLVAREHPDPSGLTARLDGAATLLCDRLGACLAPIAASPSEEIWLLRSVEVDIGLDAGADPEEIAALWGSALARAISRKLDASAQGVMFFPDRLAYLASFLRDLADGEAWSLWYYKAFAGLGALPVAAALRTAILAEPQAGVRALLRLEPWALARVIDVLGPNEAARVLDGIAGEEAAPLPAAAAILEAWTEGQAALLCPERLALSFHVALARRTPKAGWGCCRVIARALAALRLEQVHRGFPARLLGSGSLADLYRSAGARSADRLAPLLRLPESVRTALAGAASAEAMACAGARHTPHGGLFLLLTHLAEPPFDALPGPADGHALLRFLVLATCAGIEALPVFLDPVWRNLFGIAGNLLPASLEPWAASLPEEELREFETGIGGVCMTEEDVSPSLIPSLSPLLHAAAALVLARFAQRLPGFARSSAGYLRRNFLAGRARVTFFPEMIEASLGRPPLDLVLAMAGIGRERLILPWLDGRPVVLRPED
jgi:hypothetical protein